MTSKRLDRARILPAVWGITVACVTVISAGAAALNHDAVRAPCGKRPGMTAGELQSAAAAAVSTHLSGATERGRALFVQRCALCHGADGNGRGPFASYFIPRPRDFRAGKFKFVSTQNGVPSDEDLMRTIRNGLAGSAMPAFKSFSEEDLRAITAYVRTIHRQGVREELSEGVRDGTYEAGEAGGLLIVRTAPGPAIDVPAEPAVTRDRLANGRRIYVEACAACHGQDGIPPEDVATVDDDGMPDPPRAFARGVFKGGSGGRQIYCRVIKGIAGTPMPSFQGAYSAEETWNLVHFVQSLAGIDFEDGLAAARERGADNSGRRHP